MLAQCEKLMHISGMGKTTRRIGYVCHTDRLSADAQAKRMRCAGVTDVWREGEKAGFRHAVLVQTWERLERYVRDGDVIVVDRLFVLAPEGRNRHAALIKRMAAVAAKGVHIEDLWRKRSTAKPGERDMMLADAMIDLSRVGRHKSTGRPKREFSEAEVAAVDLHWRNATHRTDADAVAAINATGAKLTASIIIKRWGKSGRPYEVKKRATRKR